MAASTTGTCGAAAGGCGATQGHNGCCGANIMAAALSLAGTFTDTSKGFSGLPGGPTSSGSCSGAGAPASYALLQAYCGTSP